MEVELVVKHIDWHNFIFYRQINISAAYYCYQSIDASVRKAIEIYGINVFDYKTELTIMSYLLFVPGSIGKLNTETIDFLFNQENIDFTGFQIRGGALRRKFYVSDRIIRLIAHLLHAVDKDMVKLYLDGHVISDLDKKFIYFFYRLSIHPSFKDVFQERISYMHDDNLPAYPNNIIEFENIHQFLKINLKLSPTITEKSLFIILENKRLQKSNLTNLVFDKLNKYK